MDEPGNQKSVALSPPKGYLIVGLTEDGKEVIVNHPDIDPDKDGVGYITFSPEQARNLARLLLEKAHEIDGKLTGYERNS